MYKLQWVSYFSPIACTYMSTLKLFLCANCPSVSPKFRRDRYSKIFRMPLAPTHKNAMTMAGFQAPNPLILLEQSKQLAAKPKEAPGDLMDDDNSSVASETHGAEEQVARGNAVVAAIEAK